MNAAPAAAILLAVTAWSGVASAEDVPLPEPPPPVVSEARPGVVTEVAALPRRYDGYVSAMGGGMPNGAGRTEVVGEATALWSFADRFAAGAGVSRMPVEEGAMAFTPSVAAYAQVLRQESAGIDMTTSVRFRALGPELAGSELALRVNVGRALGPAYVAVNGGVGQGLGSRDDVDFDGGALAFVRVARVVRLGAEARVRGEIVDRYETAEDEGRPVEILSGAVVGAELGRVLVQALGGWSWPRGPLPSGPAALGALTFSF